LRGKPGGFDFQANPELHDCQRIDDDTDRRRVDECLQRQRAIAHKRAYAVACLDHSGGLQTRHRLAHHGPADPVFEHEGRLGRQLFCATQSPRDNLLAKQHLKPSGKTAAFFPIRRTHGHSSKIATARTKPAEACLIL
jgi:hypothetical protein